MSNSNILLVEREAKTRRLLRVALEQAGYEILVARDGTEALSKLEAERPDLVIAATQLPKLDGYGLVKRMKEHPNWRRIPIVFLVAGGSIEDKIRGLELGVEDYLSKPVFVKELLSRVEVLLAKQVRQHLSESVTQTRVQGRLADLSTIDILESLEQGQQSGVVRIRSGDREAEVVFEEGEIVDARLKRLRGEEVVYRLLCWTEGTFEVELKNVEAEGVIEVGTRALIEAGMRHAAEFHRLLADLPPDDVPVEVDREALVARLGEVPADLERILELLDGRRAVIDVIDESPFDDISTLQTISQLLREGLLREVPQQHPSVAPDIPRPPRTPAPPTSDVAPPPIDEIGEDRAVPVPRTRSEVSSAPPAGGEVSSAPPPSVEGFRPPSVPAVAPDVARAPIGHLAAEREEEDMAPTLRPPDGRSPTKRRPEPIALAGVPEDARPTIEIPPADQQALDRISQPRAAEAAPPAPPSAEVPEAPSAAAGHRQPEAAPPSAKGGEHGDGESGAEIRRAPKSIPPDTAAVDAAFLETPAPPTPAERPAYLVDDAAAGGGDAAPAVAGGAETAPVPPAAEPGDGPTLQVPAPASSQPGAGSERRPPPRRRRVEGEDSGPASGRTPLSTSGVAEEFFASLPPEHGPPSEPMPASDHEPVFLTAEQIARKRRGLRVVAVVVGVLCALVLFVTVRAGLIGGGPKPAPSGVSTATAPALTAGPATATATATATSTATASAATGAGAAGGAGQGGGAEGGAQSGGGKPADLPEVADPLGEAKKLLNAGRYRDTIPMAEAAIAKDPEDGDGYFYLGMAYQSIGELEKSKDAFDACVAKATKGANMSWCRTYARKK